MSFDWSEYIKVARDLADQNNEACFRAAISRLYYAVYWRARKILEAEGERDRMKDSIRSHDIVWQYYENERSPAGESIGQIGDLLKRQRNTADYRDNPVVQRKDWDIAYRRAQVILNYLDNA